MHREKRLGVRHPILLEVGWPGWTGTPGCTEDLSASGLFVRTERRLPVGAHVPVELSFPGLLRELRLTTTVVRAREPATDRVAGLGMRFLEPDPEPLRALLAAAGGAGPPPPYRVLVVEGSPLVASMYAEALRRLAAQSGWRGLEVETVNDGEGAVARLARPPCIDLAMADAQIPAGSAGSLLAPMRSEAALRGIPVVLLGAPDELGSDRRGGELLLRRPVRHRDLVATVRTLLAARPAAPLPGPAGPG